MASQLKTLMSFLTVFLLSGVWDKTNSCINRALHCWKKKGDLFGVWWNTGGLIHVTHYVAMDSFRAIYSREREKESLTNRSPPPKLSALQHWCLRFLLLLKKHGYNDYCEQRCNIVLIKDDFLNTEQILEEHKSKIGIHVWITNLQMKPVPDPNTWYIYLSVDVKPCPCVSTWAVTVLSLLSPPFSIFGRSLRVLISVWLMRLKNPFPHVSNLCPVARSPYDLLSFRLSAACSPSVTTHPLTRMRNCGENCPLNIFVR